ncbi:hypothetical protein ACH5RR_006809 [Cinchona calisaya]|uniref:Uncharacterized protein n=1 Tax=Cinchona calisaya TaxID=153742 RepID=A0ABD3AQ14_9GENT
MPNGDCNYPIGSAKLGKLPSQTIVKPKENVSAIVLSSNKEVKMQNKLVLECVKADEETEVEKEICPINKDEETGKSTSWLEYKPKLPFPKAFKKFLKEDSNRDLYETFHKCEVNIPLLEDIKQIPQYTKFFMELCTYKKKQRQKRGEKITLGKNVSSMLTRNLPKKCKDPGMCTIPCSINNTKI